MSETTITPAPSASKIAKTLKPFQPLIAAAMEGLRVATTAFTAARINVGREVGAASAALLAIGVSAEDAQSKLIAEVGGDYDWSTLAAWTRAANVYDGLPEAIRDSFSLEALSALNRVPAKDNARNDFATAQHTAGVLSVRALRDAVKEHMGTGNGAGTSKSTSKSQTAIVTKLQGVRDELFSRLGPNFKWSPELQDFINSVALLGVRVGRDGKVGTKAHTGAVEQLCYFGPEAPEDDGSADS